MKKLFLLVLIIGVSGILNLNAYSQTSTSTYTITLSGNDLKSTSGLNITYALSPASGFQLDTGVTFKANGATLLLSNVDTTKNLISLVWTGAITDGVITLTGKLTGSPTATSGVSIVKVEKAGGTDITSLVQKNVVVTGGTTNPTPTPSPTATPTTSSTSSTSSSSGGDTTDTEPSVTLEGPSVIQVLSKRVSPAKIKITANNFDKTATKCTLTSSDNTLLTVRPKTVLLDKIRKKKFSFLRIPPKKVKELVGTDFDDSAVIDVTCDNGASDAIEVEITTNANATSSDTSTP